MLPELLAPAGSPEALRAAVQNGADAVYLGLKQYGARKAAENFTLSELAEALSYCHTRGVRVYLTLNTLIGEDSLEDACHTGVRACDMGVDGLIVQDPGLAARLAERKAPLHASTQMTVYNKEGARRLQELGFRRCVLARELSLAQIREISENIQIETEVFCHGALCMSTSGQCLLSFCRGGRSGNKGDCAQPCRMRYRLNEGQPLCHLSPSDLCTLPILDGLVATGTASLKIEGRLKNPEYVAAVTGVYRGALDKLAAGRRPFYGQEDLRTLTLAFCRSHFTTGYLLGKLPSADITLDSPGRTGLPIGTVKAAPRGLPGPVPLFTLEGNWEERPEVGDGIGFLHTNGGVVNAVRGDTLTVAGVLPRVRPGDTVCMTYRRSLSRRLQTTYENGAENRKEAVTGSFTARSGCEIALTLEDGRHTVTARGPVPDKARSRATDEAEVRKALDTLGNTPYRFSSLRTDMDADLFLPVSQVKDLKRRALADLSARRCAPPAPLPAAKTGSCAKRDPAPPRINTESRTALLFYRDRGILDRDFDKMPFRIYLPLSAFRLPDVTRKLSGLQTEIYAVLPWLDREGPDRSLLQAALPYADGFLLQNIGDTLFLEPYLDRRKLAADLSFNVLNSASLEALRDMCFSTVTLSPEIDPSLLPECPDGVTPEITAAGRIPVMRSEHCPIATAVGRSEGYACGDCLRKPGRSYFLTDEKGGSYPLLPEPEHCRMMLLSKEPIEEIQKDLPRKARLFYGDKLIERINIF